MYETLAVLPFEVAEVGFLEGAPTLRGAGYNVIEISPNA